MRTTVDLPDVHIVALRELEQRKNLPRAELIRRAVALYLTTHADSLAAFGAWKHADQKPANGLTLQNKLRSEWYR